MFCPAIDAFQAIAIWSQSSARYLHSATMRLHRRDGARRDGALDRGNNKLVANLAAKGEALRNAQVVRV
jgi:hypothetical protein